MKKAGNYTIVDSSGFISLFNPDDSNHNQALKISQKLKLNSSRGLVILPSDVLVETINVIGKKFGHAEAIACYKLLLSPNVYTLLDTGPDIRKMALDKFSNLSNAVSFTDCIVMAIADQFKTRSIFGFDAIFTKNNYKLPG